MMGRRWRNIAGVMALSILLFQVQAVAGPQNTGSIGNPAGMAPNTRGVFEARPDSNQANTADELFVREASVGGQAEVQAGKLATQKAQSPAVKDFAKRMIQEHSSAAERLSALFKQATYPTSSALDMDHRV